jgi:hypothetical protein
MWLGLSKPPPKLQTTKDYETPLLGSHVLISFRLATGRISKVEHIVSIAAVSRYLVASNSKHGPRDVTSHL